MDDSGDRDSVPGLLMAIRLGMGGGAGGGTVLGGRREYFSINHLWFPS